MAYDALNNLIDAYIYRNGIQAITGQILNGVLKQMVAQLGGGYNLMGVAIPATTPATNDEPLAYVAATAGQYTDFGAITLAAGEIAVLQTSGDGTWAKQTIYNVPTGTADLENTANFITNAVTDLVNYYTKTEIDALPNGEDIDFDEDGKLQFANRVYNAQQPNGMGYKILRKDATFASQVTDTNTIYEIRYPFNLNGESVPIPVGSILKFDGGNLANGTIVGNKTSIVSPPVKIFDGVSLSGSFSNSSAYLNWWCLPSVGSTDIDVTDDVSLAFKSRIGELILNGVYAISSPVLLPSQSIVRGQARNAFKKYGFRAMTGFSGKTIDDPRNPGESLVVSGMFYHYYDYSPILKDCFVDALYNAKYCIEHVTGYSRCTIDSVRLEKALFACYVQYAGEQPILYNLSCFSSHIGILFSSYKLEDGDILFPSGTFTGSCNLVQLRQCVVQSCNYGMVAVGVSNMSMYSCKFAYNSISAFVSKSTALLATDLYSEGDGLCNFWINPDTGELTTATGGASLPYLSQSSHTIGGVTTQGRLDGFAPAFDFKFIDWNTGDRAYYRAPFYFEDSSVSIDTAYVSYINRGRGTSILPPSPTENTYDGVDAILLSQCSYINLVNIIQYNHDHAGQNVLYAYAIDLVPQSVSSTLSKIISDDGRRVGSQINRRIYVSAPCNAVSKRIVKLEQSEDNWGYTVTKFPTCGFNNDIENRLRGAGYDVNHYKYNFKQNVFSGVVKNIPLFKSIKDAGGLDGLYFKREDLQSMFPGLEQIKVVFYAKLLEDGDYQVSFSFAFSSTFWTFLQTASFNSNITGGKKGDIYRIQQIVFLNPSQSKNIESSWNYLYLRNYSNSANNIALSDILIYNVENGEELAPVYESFYMTSGTTANRPNATDVPAGTQYFDTTLGKTIVSNGTAWVNMDGTALS